MSQKSSVPQAVSFVSQVLKRDSRDTFRIANVADNGCCGTAGGGNQIQRLLRICAINNYDLRAVVSQPHSRRLAYA
jgi:hypothetical protein